jgi:hypothetical protein
VAFAEISSKALAYLADDYVRTSFIRASTYIIVSLKALEAQNLTENRPFCQIFTLSKPVIGV